MTSGFANRFRQGHADEVVRRSLQTLGFDIVASTPDEYSAYLRNEIERWTPIVKEARIQVEQ